MPKKSKKFSKNKMSKAKLKKQLRQKFGHSKATHQFNHSRTEGFTFKKDKSKYVKEI